MGVVIVYGAYWVSVGRLWRQAGNRFRNASSRCFQESELSNSHRVGPISGASTFRKSPTQVTLTVGCFQLHPDRGFIPDLGLKQSSGESVPAGAGVVYRLLGETQCGGQAWPYGGVRQLGRVRGQARGRHLRGSDGTGGTWFGWTRSNRHLSPISTPGR